MTGKEYANAKTEWLQAVLEARQQEDYEWRDKVMNKQIAFSEWDARC